MLARVKKIKFPFKVMFVFKASKKTKKTLFFLCLGLAFGLLVFKFKDRWVAAWVNNRPITRRELDRELEKQMGEQALESLVTKSLILQQAKKEKIKTGQDELAKEIESIEAELEKQGMDLDSYLLSLGQDREGLEEQITIQLILEKLLGSEMTVSDEEAQAYFEENKEAFFSESSFEDEKERIVEVLKQQKMGEAFQTWLEEVKENSRIYYFLKF